MNTLYIYDASAGAGKTHALVHYYLSQALQEPGTFRHILAITFTNKATQEMKERILIYLRRLSAGRALDLAQLLQQSLHCSIDEVRGRAQVLLHEILHDYSHFSLTTIDHLFNSLVAPFSRELGIPPDCTVRLPSSLFFQEVLDAFWAGLPRGSTLYQLLLQSAYARLQQGRSWHLERELMAIAHDWVQNPDTPEARERASAENSGVWALLLRRAADFRETLAQKATYLYTQIKKQGIPPTEFAWGKQGIYGYIEKLAHKQIRAPSARIRQAQEGTWLRKTSPYYATGESLVAQAWRPLFIELLDYYRDHHVLYQTVQDLQTLRYAMLLRPQIAQQLEKYPSERHELLIFHLPGLLRLIMEGTPPSLLGAKMGKAYTRLLIDEFQDVSQSQWQTLAPLLKSALKSGASSLLVGDVKQAIYRWRGGDPTLLLTQVEKEIGRAHIQRKTLPLNWRSPQEIVDFNNQIFQAAPHYLYETLAQQVREEVADKRAQTAVLQQMKQIPQAYRHAAQEVPRHPSQAMKRGYIHIRFLAPPPKDNPAAPQAPYDWKEESCTCTIRKIEDLQRHGYRPQDIALLVRDHAEVRLLLRALLTHQKSPQADARISYHAFASSGLPLHEHPCIVLLTAALDYLEDQKSTALSTLVHLSHTYPKKRKPAPHPHTYFSALAKKENRRLGLPEAFIHAIDTLARLPLTHLVSKLIEIFHLQQPDARPYLTLFQEHVHRFQGQGGLGNFLQWWRLEGVKIVLPTDGQSDGLTITTLHQAKGLAYKVVLLPFCAWALDHPPHAAPILWAKSTEPPFQRLGRSPMYYKKTLKKTHYRHAYYEEQWQVYLEQLNLLYVAFTRAEEQLHVLAPDLHPGAQVPKNVASLLRATLRATHDLSLGQQELQIGKAPQVHKRNAPRAQSTPPQFYNDPRGYEQALAALSAPPDLLGTWWHDFFASIKTLEDFAAVLAHHLSTRRIDGQMAKAVRTKLKKWMNHALFLDWFRGYDHVSIEQSIGLPDGTILRPDRIIIQGKKAMVVDFKSGKPRPSHEEQVRTYMHLLSTMGHQPVEGYLFYLYEDRIVPISQ